ncbi:pilus assembly protein TadG-related protein [Vibrio sp. V39_P1S14PM300]|uniref:pilus assembly protein TadG-related protein n=1 Tax=Vibrio sp. V39_P1S14PM300 TaxID=1938690 RepID=UPI0013724964|nr:pilus assembly protein TadG-related protein [Vibrio sp. V39_P1S14PM300]NAX20077.1 hypothetical protein [Vibrio sp. V39_P1S14PM300]
MTFRRQRGAIGIGLVAAMLSLILFASLAVDTARLVYQRQSLQSIADLSALEVVRSTPYFVDDAVKTQLETALSNKYQDKISSVQVRFGTARVVDNQWVVDTDDSPENGYSAAQVIVTKVVPQSMIAGGLFNNATMTLTAQAAIQKSGLIRFGIGSKTLATKESNILNAVLSDALGIDVDLTVADYQGVANSTIKLSNVLTELAIKEGLATPQEVLDASINIADLMTTYVSLLTNDDDATYGLDLVVDQLALAVGLPEVVLGDILTIPDGSNTQAAALTSDLNALDLLTATVYAANQNNFLSIPDLSLGIPGVLSSTSQVSVIEPPQFTIATLPVVAGMEPKVTNAQTQVNIEADLDLFGLISIGDVTDISTTPLSIQVDTSQSTATLTDVADNTANFSTLSSLADISVDNLTITATILGIDIDITAQINVENKDPVSNTLSIDLEDVATADGSYVVTVTRDQEFSTSVVLTVETDINAIPILGPLIKAIVNNTLLATLNPLVSTIVDSLLSDLLIPILESLGLQVGGADMWVDAANVSQYGLIE